MHNLMQDIRYAVRTLAKAPAFAAVAVLTLALGIGANTAIFSVIDGVLLKPLALPQADQVVSVWQRGTNFPRYGISEGQHVTLKAEAQSFRELASYHTLVSVLTGADQPDRIPIAHVSAGMLTVMGLAPVLGRDFLPEENLPRRNNVVLLSFGAWQRRYGGDRGVVGRTLHLDEQPMTIIGVLPANALLPEDLSSPEKIELWQAEVLDAANPNRWGSHYLGCLARLKPGVSVANARAEVQAMLQRLRSEHPESDPKDPAHALFVRPLPQDLTADSRQGLLVLLGAVALVLLIACANVANLLLARGAAREKELAIRAALGAARGRLVTQLLGETALLALLGGVVGCGLAWWGLDALTALRPGDLPRLDEVRIDARVLLFAFVLSALTTFLFGLAPALQMTHIDLNASLRQESGGASAGRTRQRLQRLLVTSEIALAVVLVLGAGLLGRSLYEMLSIDPGFRVESLLTLRVGVPASKYAEGKQAGAYFDEALLRVRAIPGVVSASNVNAMPLTGFGGDTVFEIEGRPSVRPGSPTWGIRSQHLGMRSVGPDYFATLGIRLLRGRTFTEQDGADSQRVVVINDTMARRHWGDQDPVGQRIALYRNPTDLGPWTEIIGVVADTKIRSLTEPPKEEAVFPFAQNPERGTVLVIRAAGAPKDLFPAVRDVVRSLEPQAVVSNVRTMNEALNATVAQPRLNLGLIGAFSALALVLAVVGVYGVMSYAVSQRTREIGIRMALGAHAGDVLRLVLRQGLQITLMGLVVGVAASLALAQVMQKLLYGISAADPLTFATVAVVLTAVALAACYFPARRAARVDPMVALRHE